MREIEKEELAGLGDELYGVWTHAAVGTSGLVNKDEKRQGNQKVDDDTEDNEKVEKGC